MGDTIQLAVMVFAASWILSMFLGAGPKGLVRTIGTALAAVALFLAQIISAVLTILTVVGIILLIWVAFRFLRWLIFGSRPNRRWR